MLAGAKQAVGVGPRSAPILEAMSGNEPLKPVRMPVYSVCSQGEIPLLSC